MKMKQVRANLDARIADYEKMLKVPHSGKLHFHRPGSLKKR